MGGGEGEGEGEGEDPQKLKQIGAAAYDYENDARWADYWSNVLLPPHMSSRSDVVDHFKRKFYQRYIDPDLLVEPMATTTTPARPSIPSAQSTSSSASGSNLRQRNSGSATRTSGTPVTPPPNSTSLRWDSQTIQFSVNAWVFLVGVLSVFPFVPRILSNRAYRLSFFGAACSSLYSLYSSYGGPRAWNLQALQVCLKFALIPILCRTLDHVTKFLRQNFSHSTLYRRYLEKACVWVESNTTTVGVLSSQAEIGIGFLLIISLFSWQRNIIQGFMYWQLLKLMYQSPATAVYHQNTWSKIGRSVNPLMQRYAPFLNTPISAIQRWWFR